MKNIKITNKEKTAETITYAVEIELEKENGEVLEAYATLLENWDENCAMNNYELIMLDDNGVELDKKEFTDEVIDTIKDLAINA